MHAGRHIDAAIGEVAQPIHLSTTFERDAGRKWSRGFTYSRKENPDRQGA